MPGSVLLLWRSLEGRRHGMRLAVAVVLVAFGSGALAQVWAILLLTNGYEVSEAVRSAFSRLQMGTWGTIVLVAVIAPFFEELLFRAGLQRVLLWFYRPAIAIVAGALVFAAIHLNWMQFGPALWMGLVTGTIFARTASFSLCFLWHMTYNAQFALATALAPGGGSQAVPEVTWQLVLALGVHGVFLVVGLVLLRRSLAALPEQFRPRWRRGTGDNPGASLITGEQ